MRKSKEEKIQAFLNDVINQNPDLTQDELLEMTMAKIQEVIRISCPFELYEVEEKLIDLIWGTD
jgi:hypothetical protein